MLEQQRQHIDHIDQQIVRLFEERMHIVEEVARIKQAHNKPILDASRETLLLEKVSGFLSDSTLTPALETLYQTILTVSKEHQQSWIQQHQSENNS